MGFSSYRGGRSGFCSTPSSAATMAVLLQVIIALFASASPVPATPLLRTTRQGSDGTTCSITGVGESTYILMRAGPCWSNTLDSSPQLVNGDTVIDYDGELSCMDSDVSVDCLGPEGVDPPYLAPGDCWRGVEYQGTVTGYIPVSFLDCSTTSRYRVHLRRESVRTRGLYPPPPLSPHFSLSIRPTLPPGTAGAVFSTRGPSRGTFRCRSSTAAQLAGTYPCAV